MLKHSTRKIEAHFSPIELDELQLKDKDVVVIDVLRSSTTIAQALSNGAKEIIPVADIESAVKISGSLSGDVILRGGERHGKMIEGFDLGNSPLEYSEQVVRGKSIIYLTSNGTSTIQKGRYARNLIVGGFVNISAVVKLLGSLRNDLVLICAGSGGKFCLEDSVCLGKIVTMLEQTANCDFYLDDCAIAAKALDKTFGKNVLKMLQNSVHGKYLTEIGFKDDLKICSQIDSIPVIPVFTGNVLRLKSDTNVV